MPATDLPLLIDAARAAGRVAGAFAGPHARRWDKPGGAGPVTEADLAANDILRRTLRLARPDYGWLSEESEDTTARLKAQHTFIVDPIDGTRSFVEGSKTWAHALAVADKGSVTAAVVYLPMRGLLYAAALDRGATLNGVPIRVAQSDRMCVLAARPAMKPEHWKAGAAPECTRSYRPSLAYRMAVVAQGRFDAMLTLRPTWEWDIAAGSLIVTEAGGTVTDRTGAPLRFNNTDPRLDGVLAGVPEAHANLLAGLA